MYIEAYSDRQIAEGKERLTMAYLTAAWSRANKLPKLEQILKKMDKASKPDKEQTPEEMLAMLNAWATPVKPVEEVE